MLEGKYKNTYGTWNVRTEGDVEGRSMKNLGTFTGHIDEIALHLADQCYFSLKFTATDTVTEFIPKRKCVNVVLGIDSGIWKADANDSVKELSELFKDRSVTIEKGQYYKSFKICTNDENVEDKIKEAEKQKVLDKLSEKEKEILGLI